MNHLTAIQKKITRVSLMLFLGLFTTTTLLGQATITYNIGNSYPGNVLTIPATPANNYILTGSSTVNTVVIEKGYNGTITLESLTITSSKAGDNRSGYRGTSNNVSCITVLGQNSLSNMTPVTKVNFILKGTNTLTYTQNHYCAIQVNQGAQIHISAIDANDNASGKLLARCTAAVGGQTGGGAAIGAPSFESNTSHGQGSASISCGGTAKTAGGNIIIASGTVTAEGGHAAGIGGAHYTYYDGVIVVYGGVVHATAKRHAAGIGSGCPTGSGVFRNCYAPNSAIIALPPATITGYGKNLETGPNDPTLALAGAKNITYLNDPNKHLIKVYTEDYEKNANIYLDLTQNTGIVNIFSTLGIGYDLAKVHVGRTSASTGIFEFKGELQEPTTFFTDASSSQPTTLGRPYLPKVVTVSAPTNVELELLKTNISFTDYPSTPLELPYTAAQAKTNAFRVKVEYNDTFSMTDVTFALQSGANFVDLQFFSDLAGTTPIPKPTTFTTGMVFYILVQIKQNKPIGVYEDVMLIGGKYNNIPLPGYIRRVGMQRIVKDDSNENNHIKVTANLKKFTAAYPTTNAETLTLNIDHTGMSSITYNPLDVKAKYLVTTIADYDLALAASPLNGPDWANLNIPPANNTNTPTTVPFGTRPAGTYYIHWYVESGAAYAHSLTVSDPVRTYGGFGPYIIFPAEITLSLDKTSIEEGGGSTTGTATLTAKLDGTELAPANITINFTYGGSATHGTGKDYTAPTSITIPAGSNKATINFVALTDYIVEGPEAIAITAPPTVTVGGLTYDVISTSLSNISIVDKTNGAVSMSRVGDAAEPNTKGQVMFKFPGSGATAVTCAYPVKVVYSYSGTSATGNYTPNSPAEAIIPSGQNSVTVNTLTPINNYVVEGSREVTVTITSVMQHTP